MCLQWHQSTVTTTAPHARLLTIGLNAARAAARRGDPAVLQGLARGIEDLMFVRTCAWSSAARQKASTSASRRLSRSSDLVAEPRSSGGGQPPRCDRSEHQVARGQGGNPAQCDGEVRELVAIGVCGEHTVLEDDLSGDAGERAALEDEGLVAAGEGARVDR